MGQAGSSQLAPAASRRHQHRASAAPLSGGGGGGGGGGRGGGTLPQEPLRLAPKVLPSLDASPRLRCTDNGAILHSGGTISGRRALSATLPSPHHQHQQHNRGQLRHQHTGVYRSRSASSGEQAAAAEAAGGGPPGAGPGGGGGRNLLHRSHTHLDLHDPLDSTASKKFGSEPDLRSEEEQPKQRTNKHFRKKYKAPPPPTVRDARDGSSPDSYDGNNRGGPGRKLRLFKTRSETKNIVSTDAKSSHHCHRHHTEPKSFVEPRTESQSLERRYKQTNKEKDQFLNYPDIRERDMVQSSASLRIEEHQLQPSVAAHRYDYRKCKNDKSNVYRSKASKPQDYPEGNKTPYLDRTFRYSERFKKQEIDPPVLRREKSFDAALAAKERDSKESLENIHCNRIKVIGEQLKISRLSPLAPTDKPFRKSLPSLLVNNNEEKDEFQVELKRATNKLRTDNRVTLNENGLKTVHENKPSQNDIDVKTKFLRNNPPKTKKQAPMKQNKVTESSPKICSVSVLRKEPNFSKIKGDERSPIRKNQTEDKKLKEKQNAINKLGIDLNGHAMPCKRESRAFADRGQASGKESTPEHSPTRLKAIEKLIESDKCAPSKHFYFGMIENEEVDIKENVKEFPGLGTPIIDHFNNFHLIEKKLLSYHKKEMEVENFATRLQENDHNTKNVSSESALSSSEEEAGSARSAESRGIALHLRPTLPKKQLEIPRFSPAAAWRQLAQVEAEPDFTDGPQSLALEVRLPEAVTPPEESPRRSDKSGDKSGDSGISGDHAISDERLHTPPHRLPHAACMDVETSTWTPQQDLEGDSGSDGAGGGGGAAGGEPTAAVRGEGLVTYSARGQPFSLSLPRDRQPNDKNKQFQQPFNSLQKLKKSVSGALGAALGSRRFDLEHEPILDDPSEQNWFLSKSAPNSLTNPFLYPHNSRAKGTNEGDIKEEPTPPASDQEEGVSGADGGGGGGGGGGGRGASYLSWGGHVMYLPPAPAPLPGDRAPQHAAQPMSILLTTMNTAKPIRSKSSGEIELRSRAARELREEMRERERSASPEVGAEGVRAGAGAGQRTRGATAAAERTGSLARALPARIVTATPSPATTPPNTRGSGGGGSSAGSRTRGKRFTFQSTVRQLERRRVAERLSREADLKEQQRRTELEAMRRVEEEFQRKRAREKASIRQQLRLVSGSASLPPPPPQLSSMHHTQARDEPDGAVSPRGSPAPALPPPAHDKERRVRRDDERDHRHSNTSSEISARSKSTTPVRCVELSEWREGGGGCGAAARQYRDWGAPAGSQAAHAHPPACYRMPKSTAPLYLNANGKEAVDTFSGSPRSDNYRLEFARGVPRSPRTPRAPRHPLASHRAPHSPSSSSSELSATARQPIRLREGGRCAGPEPDIVPTLQRAAPAAAPARLAPLTAATTGAFR